MSARLKGAESVADCDDPDAYHRFGTGLFLAGVEALAGRWY